MSTMTKDAAKDAAEFARAKMFYGEGAGTRRRLISSAVEYKSARIPGYQEAFERAYRQQDLTKHIKAARRERKFRDISTSTSKNVRAMARGDRNGMSSVLVIGFVVGAALHQSGYDKVLYEKGKAKAQKARSWLKDKL